MRAVLNPPRAAARPRMQATSNRATPAGDDNVTDGRATRAGPVRLPSDHDAFDLVERDRVRRPVVQLRRPGRRMAGNLLGVLERTPVR